MARYLASLVCVGLVHAQDWPTCQEENIVIRNAGRALFTNLQGFGATVGCFQDDCQNSDKFVASSIESCTKATCSCTDSQGDVPPFLEEVQSFPLGSDGTVIAVSDADGMLDIAWLEYAMPCYVVHLDSFEFLSTSCSRSSTSSTQGLEGFQPASSVQPEELPPDDMPLLCVSLEPSPSSSRPSEIAENSPREEPIEAPEEQHDPLEEMSGWLMCYGEPSSGNRLQVTRLAKASAGTPVAGTKMQQDSDFLPYRQRMINHKLFYYGHPVSRFFWKKRYIVLKDSQLLCWATQQQGPKKQAPSAILILSQLEEVAVEGKTLSLHMRNQKLALQARADTEELANKWAAAVKSHAGRAISKSLPPGWDVEAMLSSGVGGSAAKLVNKELLPSTCQPAFQKLLDHCFVCKSTKDRRGNTVPLRLEIVDAVRVQNGAAWMEYSKARTRICEKALATQFLSLKTVFENNQWLKQSLDSESCSSFTNSEGRPSRIDTASGSDSATFQWDPFGMQTPLLTSTLDLKALQEILGKTDQSSNEQLFHGTSREAVENISDREFRLDKAGSHRGTLYGKGIYFAECATKADEYCVEDADGYCWMLLCRVALGTEKKPSPDILEQCIAGKYDSLIGDRWTAVGTFREFILFDSDQVYPAFILRYKRWSEAAFCRCIRETAESEDTGMGAELYPHAAILAEEHPDSTVRYRLSLLMDAHSDSVVPVLCDALKDRRRRVRLNATKALMNMAGQTSSVEALPDGSRYRRHRDGVHVVISAVPALTRFVRRAAARALERLGEHAGPAVPNLIMSLRDREEEVRAAVATALGQLGPAASEALPALLQASLDHEESVRVAALSALGFLGLSSSAVCEVLTDALQDPSSEVKSAAATALGMLSAVAAVDSLADCLSDGQSHVRAAAARALGYNLGQIGGKHTASAVPHLTQSLKDSDHVVRRSAAVSLGRIGPFAASAAPNLADAMRDGNSQVREAAATSICRLGVCIQSLVKRGLSDACAEVRQAAAESLLELARSDQLGSHKTTVREAMTVRLKDENAKVRGIASTCLGLIQEEAPKKKKKHKAKKKGGESGREHSPGADVETEDDLDPQGVLELEDIARLVLSLTRRVCQSLPECEFWVWGQEEGEQKCWFRLGDDGREAGEGWISGSRSCYPPGQQAIVMGNFDCWIDGFNYDTCCDPKFGPSGNSQCWDGVFNYDRCCFPKEEL
eukprot:s576_g19.t1